MQIVSSPYQFGLEDAQANEPCIPEIWFIKARDCALYAAGYCSQNPTEAAQAALAHYGGIEAAWQAQSERNASQVERNEAVLASLSHA